MAVWDFLEETMHTEQDVVIRTTLHACARCKGDHAEMLFTKFHRPVVDDDGTVWGWWALCPATGEPVLMKTDSPSDD